MYNITETQSLLVVAEAYVTACDNYNERVHEGDLDGAAKQCLMCDYLESSLVEHFLATHSRGCEVPAHGVPHRLILIHSMGQDRIEIETV